ncbi:hypothetical protein DFJ74DRAFT_647596 [Hyaloraphidium curvatum]|nr:hypothetical protein DFJ74DRAFT_647596 [Hyaloraphidium curvatum]
MVGVGRTSSSEGSPVLQGPHGLAAPSGGAPGLVSGMLSSPGVAVSPGILGSPQSPLPGFGLPISGSGYSGQVPAGFVGQQPFAQPQVSGHVVDDGVPEAAVHALSTAYRRELRDRILPDTLLYGAGELGPLARLCMAALAALHAAGPAHAQTVGPGQAGQQATQLALADALRARLARAAEPFYSGSRSPTFEACLGMLCLSLLLSLSADPARHRAAQAYADRLASLLRELGLDDESRGGPSGRRNPPTTRERTLGWAAHAHEQHLLLDSLLSSPSGPNLGVRHAPDLCLCIPHREDTGPVSLADLEAGFETLVATEPTGTVRQAFLALAVRRMADAAVAAHRHNVRQGGHHILPAELVEARERASGLFVRLLAAEDPSNPAHPQPLDPAHLPGGAPLPPHALPALRALPLRGLLALSLCPALDLRPALAGDPQARARIAAWLALPTLDPQALGPAAGNAAVAANGVLRCYEHCAAGAALLPLLPTNLSFPTPDVPRAVYTLAMLDLAAFALAPGSAYGAASRLTAYAGFFDNMGGGWPLAGMWAAAFTEACGREVRERLGEPEGMADAGGGGGGGG